MNLAVANPGQCARMMTLATGLPVLVFRFFLPVLPVLIIIVFESRRRYLFVWLILSSFLAFYLIKLEPYVSDLLF